MSHLCGTGKVCRDEQLEAGWGLDDRAGESRTRTSLYLDQGGPTEASLVRGFAPITLAGSRDRLQETSDDLEAKMTCPSRDKRFPC